MTDNTEAKTEAQRAAELLAQFERTEPAIDVSALIAEARANMPSLGEAKDDTVEVADAELVNTLLARVSDVKAQMKALAAEEDTIKTFLKELVLAAEQGGQEGSVSGLRVHGAVVFTYSQSTSRVLNQTQVKAMFPDIPENEELWSTQTRRTALFK